MRVWSVYILAYVGRCYEASYFAGISRVYGKKSTLAFHDAFEETLEYLNFPAFCSKMTRFWQRMGDNDKYKKWFIVFYNK